MFSTVSSRRGFAARLAALLPGIGMAGMVSSSASAAEDQGSIKKLDYEGKPASSKGFITPLIVYNGVIYIAGQGAHSRGNDSDKGKQPDIEQYPAADRFSYQDGRLRRPE
jgi:hypothetical protein